MNVHVDTKPYDCTTIFVEWLGDKKSLSFWSEFFSIDKQLIRQRWQRGVRPPELFGIPTRKKTQDLKGSYDIEATLSLPRTDKVRKLVKLFALGFSLREMCEKLDILPNEATMTLRRKGLYVDYNCNVDSVREQMAEYHQKQACYRELVRLHRFCKLPPDIQDEPGGEAAAVYNAKRLEHAAFPGVRSHGFVDVGEGM